MSEKHYRTSITVEQTPEEVFVAINNPRGWWSQAIEGETDKLGAVFYYHYRDVHRATFKITEMAPMTRVVWHVLNNSFNFVGDQTEWVGTDVVFEIARHGDKTELQFTHVGLVPAYECYDVCYDAWTAYIKGSLRNLIIAGEGQPNPLEEVVARARVMSESL